MQVGVYSKRVVYKRERDEDSNYLDNNSATNETDAESSNDKGDELVSIQADDDVGEDVPEPSDEESKDEVPMALRMRAYQKSKEDDKPKVFMGRNQVVEFRREEMADLGSDSDLVETHAT